MSRPTIILAALATTAAPLLFAAAPAVAQEAGDSFVRVAAARTKLVDKGEIRVNGEVDATAAYKTRATYHGVVTAGYYPISTLAVEASVTTPATTNNIPAGSLAGTPNLGDDEFVVVTLGGSYHPIKGPVSPYIGGGLALHFTTQERDGLAVGLDIKNTHGPYVAAGVDVALTPRLGIFAEARKSFYTTRAGGLLPLDATYTRFARVDAAAQLDPLAIQVGMVARFGRNDAASPAIEPDDSPWLIRAGVTTLSLADKVDLMVGGARYPGAGLSTFEHQTVSVQVARFVTPNIAINATVGFPPKIDIYGAGSIGALPKLGEVRYGPTALTVQYHPLRSGRIRPYVGVGASYMIVFGTKDGAFQNLKVDNDLAWAFEAGTELVVAQRTGLFIDVKKALLRPRTYGSFMGARVEGATRLDPWAFTGGVAFHF